MAQEGWTKPSEEEYRGFASFDVGLIKTILDKYLLTDSSMSDVAREVFSDAKDSRTISQITRCLGFAGKNEYTDGTVTSDDVSAYVDLYHPAGYREESQPDFDALVAERKNERRRREEQEERERRFKQQLERENDLKEREELFQKKLWEQAERDEIERKRREEAERAVRQRENERKRELERAAKEAEEQTRIQKLAYEWHKISTFIANNNVINALDESTLIDGYDYLYDLNYNDAVYNYGWFFHNLSLKTSTEENKAAYLVMAAKANYPISMNDYGVLIESGKHGADPDPAGALAWYEGAAQRGNDLGSMNAGRLLFEMGEFPKAKQYLESVKDKFGEFWIKQYWAKAAIRSAHAKVKAHSDVAGEYYDEVMEALLITSDDDDKLFAALVLFYSAVYDYMRCYKITEKTREQEEKQRQLYIRLEKASEYGLPDADVFLGDYFYYMNPDNPHIEKARRHYSAAVEKGNARAAYMLAKTYITENVYSHSDAIPLMERAAGMGSRDAEIWLKRNLPQKPVPVKSSAQ